MRVDWGTGLVTDVERGGQAAHAGVEDGMVIIQVDGHAYSEQVLNRCRAQQRSFNLTFKTKELNREGVDFRDEANSQQRGSMPSALIEANSQQRGSMPSASTYRPVAS